MISFGQNVMFLDWNFQFKLSASAWILKVHIPQSSALFFCSYGLFILEKERREKGGHYWWLVLLLWKFTGNYKIFENNPYVSFVLPFCNHCIRYIWNHILLVNSLLLGLTYHSVVCISSNRFVRAQQRHVKPKVTVNCTFSQSMSLWAYLSNSTF